MSDLKRSVESPEVAIARIVGHADIPQKQVAVGECLDDIETRYQQGGLDRAQKRRPIAVLLGVRPCSRGGLRGQVDLW
jgi:hypothetical protein